MSFSPLVENRCTDLRYCKCGAGHNAEIIQGMLHYSESNYTAYKVALMEHDGRPHAWVAFITGGWDGVEAENCCILIELYVEDGSIMMFIAPEKKNPFYDKEIFDSYVLSKREVVEHEDAKNWVIEIYQNLFIADPYILKFINYESS